LSNARRAARTAWSIFGAGGDAVEYLSVAGSITR
jgi:hypothetical protein